MRLEKSLKEHLDKNFSDFTNEKLQMRGAFEDTQKYVSQQLRMKEQELGSLNDNIEVMKRDIKSKYKTKF
jgi:hypothetical protein